MTVATKVLPHANLKEELQRQIAAKKHGKESAKKQSSVLESELEDYNRRVDAQRLKTQAYLVESARETSQFNKQKLEEKMQSAKKSAKHKGARTEAEKDYESLVQTTYTRLLQRTGSREQALNAMKNDSTLTEFREAAAEGMDRRRLASKLEKRAVGEAEGGWDGGPLVTRNTMPFVVNEPQSALSNVPVSLRGQGNQGKQGNGVVTQPQSARDPILEGTPPRTVPTADVAERDPIVRGITPAKGQAGKKQVDNWTGRSHLEGAGSLVSELVEEEHSSADFPARPSKTGRDKLAPSGVHDPSRAGLPTSRDDAFHPSRRIHIGPAQAGVFGLSPPDSKLATRPCSAFPNSQHGTKGRDPILQDRPDYFPSTKSFGAMRARAELPLTNYADGYMPPPRKRGNSFTVMQHANGAADALRWDASQSAAATQADSTPSSASFSHARKGAAPQKPADNSGVLNYAYAGGLRPSVPALVARENEKKVYEATMRTTGSTSAVSASQERHMNRKRSEGTSNAFRDFQYG